MSQEPVKAAEDLSQFWPALPLAEWQDTYATLHMWTQVVGKVALAKAPMINHWWQTSLRVSARGFTTVPLPHGERQFQIAFDFCDHRLHVEESGGQSRSFALASYSVADFYEQVMGALASLDLAVEIWTTPVEVETRIPFEQDRQHATYDPEAANRFWRILVESDRLFRAFRSSFLGKVSPVQFFWGSFDLAVTRFSGRRAPAYTGGAFNVSRRVMQEAYSHEVSSLGFWPGGGAVPYPAYYSYAVPRPAGFEAAAVRPEGAYFHEELGEFILPYDVVRSAGKPDQALLDFAQSTYEAAADLGHWERVELERQDTPPPMGGKSG